MALTGMTWENLYGVIGGGENGGGSERQDIPLTELPPTQIPHLYLLPHRPTLLLSYRPMSHFPAQSPLTHFPPTKLLPVPIPISRPPSSHRYYPLRYILPQFFLPCQLVPRPLQRLPPPNAHNSDHLPCACISLSVVPVFLYHQFPTLDAPSFQ